MVGQRFEPIRDSQRQTQGQRMNFVERDGGLGFFGIVVCVRWNGYVIFVWLDPIADRTKIFESMTDDACSGERGFCGGPKQWTRMPRLVSFV